MHSRAFAFTVALSTAIIAILLTFTFSHVAATLKVDEQEALRSLVAQVSEEINTSAKTLAAQAELAAHMPPLGRAVAAGTPEALTALMGESYAVLAKKYGVAVGQVNGVNGNVLFRFHEPAVRGDDFTRSRRIIVAAHASLQPQSGIEIGSSGVRVRGAAPVSHEGTLVGSIEFGQELGPLLETLKARTNADFAVVIDRRLLNVRPGTPEANVFGNLRGDSGTNWPLVAKLSELGKIALVKEPVFSFATLNGMTYGSVSSPLLDYSGSEIGVVVAAKSFNANGRSLRQLAISLIAGGIIAEIGIVAIILLVFRGMVLRPVAIVAKAAEAAAEGAAAVDLPKAGTVAEVNALIASVKRLREKVTS
ncbi:hypothetical protein E8L99_20900 [Phreatobacter aquaticus]|uniref:Double Cache domain-containing protein n=1 Tax=Phreatobacter aquaticus TaxID=2570229 RepID=A0A4D7QSN8_9HYPH|nr:cache domain-containing protein [Phreatobacter aquaticus]QCK88037.1 hypothetical protein E8L99_20900 [Phreatobacter aquaticus]